jgi:hypothetical protein
MYIINIRFPRFNLICQKYIIKRYIIETQILELYKLVLIFPMLPSLNLDIYHGFKNVTTN